MDYKNKSIPIGQITSFDVNKTIQRSLTKACARYGLGLYVYVGEDLPEDANEQKTQPKNLFQMINECKSEDELKKVWNDNRQKIYGDKKLLELITLKGKELKNSAA